MHNVMYIPEFKHNLLSVSKLTMELNCSVHFYPDFCSFHDLFSGRVKGIGKHVQDLCGGFFFYECRKCQA